MSYVLDSCIFNKLTDGIIDMNDLPSDGPFFATHIQIDELKATKDPKRQAALLSKFNEVVHPKILPTETFVADVSHVDCDKVGGGVLFEKLKNSLNLRNKSKSNNTQDALIAEVANMNGLTLITSDMALSNVAKEHGGKVIFLKPNKNFASNRK